MHHKRKKPRNQRAGCKMCKYWKVNGFGKEREGREPHSDLVRRLTAKRKVDDNGNETRVKNSKKV